MADTGTTQTPQNIPEKIVEDTAILGATARICQMHVASADFEE